MKNKISSSFISKANLDIKIDFLGAIITKFYGAAKVHDALEEGRGEEVDKTEEYVSKGLTEGFIKIEEFVLEADTGTGSSTASTDKI